MTPDQTSRALRACALALVLTLPGRTLAAEAEGGAKAQGIVDVELPPILAPMIVAARLDSYAYITVALAPAGADKVFPIREKVPFLQDAFLRELNKGSIAKADDPKAVDTDAVKARLTQRMNQILPAGTVAELKLEQIVLAPLQPQ
jgi:hypothetical protein